MAEDAENNAVSTVDATEIADGPTYFFRGDDNFYGGSVGRALGKDADSANIQTFADHVLRKEAPSTSRYISFSEVVGVARKFTKTVDNRHLRKVQRSALEVLEAAGHLKIWSPDRVYLAMRAGSKKQAKQAGDVLAVMVKNSEVLIEGQIPPGLLEHVH